MTRPLPSPLSKQLPTSLTGYTLQEHLQADTRPTFLIDTLALDNAIGQDVDTILLFVNAALTTNTSLLDKILYLLAETFSKRKHSNDGDQEAVDFLSWILGDIQSSTWFANILWSSTDIDARWRIVSGVYVPQLKSSTRTAIQHSNQQEPDIGHTSISLHPADNRSRPITHVHRKSAHAIARGIASPHSEVLFSSGTELTSHQQRMQIFNWADTELGPIRIWPETLYQAMRIAIINPMPVFIFWGPSRIVFWNDAGIPVLRGFGDVPLGTSAFQVFGSFWNQLYEPVCKEIERTGRSVAPSKSPGPLIERDGGLRETFWTYCYQPLLDESGDVCGIYDQVYDSTTEVLTEGRIDTLLKVNEAMSAAKDLKSFWQMVLGELERNAADVPLAAIYSIGGDAMIDQFTDVEMKKEWQMSSNVNFRNDTTPIKGWTLEGNIGFSGEHVCIPAELDFHDTRGLSAAFRRISKTPDTEDTLLCTETGTLPADFLAGCQERGLGFECTQLIICSLQRPSGGVIAWLVLGINPRRTFDDEYKRFTRLLSRHIESKLVLVLTLEREKKIASQDAEQAAYKQQQLSLELQAQRREAEQNHARFFNFAKQVHIGVFVLGSDGEVKYCNDAWYKLFDLVPGTAIPKAWVARTHPDDTDFLKYQWDRLVKGLAQDGFEWRALRPGSNSFASEDDVLYLESCGFPELADDGTVMSVTGITLDVSIHKAYQREQTEKLEVALEAKRAQEYFMDMVSHEMRNPLNAIIQCSEETSQLIEQLTDGGIAKDGMRSTLEDVGEMIDTILYCGAHQKQLIDDVLTLSKLDSSLLIVHPVEVNYKALVRQAMRVYGSEIRASEIEVFISSETSTNDDEESATIMADPSRIVQVLVNLVGNAIKFMKGREKRELHIKAYTSSERRRDSAMRYISSGNVRPDPTSKSEWGNGEPVYLYVSVRDTGPGLSEAEMSSLFNRFQQASPRTHVTYGGSGLGLFISRELTELHGGEVGIASQVDQGSTFVFYIKGRQICQPGTLLSSAPSSPSSQKKRKASGANHSNAVSTTTSVADTSLSADTSLKMHILVVEDNEINQKVLKRQLQRLGCQVTTANHGEEALSIVKTSTWWQNDQTQELGMQHSRSSKKRPQLSVILCDLEMPVMDGVTFVRHVRQWQSEGLLHARIPIVAVTGNARAEQKMPVDGSGFDLIVSKPYSLMNMVSDVSALVDQTSTAPA